MLFYRLKHVGKSIIKTSYTLENKINNTFNRHITLSSYLCKRYDGNSTYLKKSNSFPNKKSKNQIKKYKYDLKNHNPDLHKPFQKKINANQLKRERKIERDFKQFESDPELIASYDRVFDDIMAVSDTNLDYKYMKEEDLKNINEERILKDLQEGKIDETCDNYLELFKMYAKKGQIDKAEDLLTSVSTKIDHKILHSTSNRAKKNDNNLTKINTSESIENIQIINNLTMYEKFYLYLICSYAKKKEAAKAVEVIGRMKKLNIQLKVPHYNSAMHACIKEKKYQWAHNLFENMKEDGLHPDQASFTILINGFVALNEMDKAFEIFHLMRTYSNDHPDCKAFNSFMTGYARQGNAEKCIYLYDDMIACRVIPSVETFNILIYGCGKSKAFIHKSFEYFRDMQNTYDYRPDLTTYHNLLHSCSLYGDVPHAMEIKKIMDSVQVPFDVRFYNIMFNILSKAQIRKRVICALSYKLPPPKPEPIHQNLNTYDEDGNLTDVKPEKDFLNYGYEDDQSINHDDILTDDNDNEIQNDEITQELTNEEKLYIKQVCDERPKELSIACKNILVGDCQHNLNYLNPHKCDFHEFQKWNMKKSDELFHEMIQKGIQPNKVTLNSYLNVYASALKLNRANDILNNKFMEYNIVPDSFTYRTIIRMYLRAKRFKEVEDILIKLNDNTHNNNNTNNRIIIDKESYAMIADAYAKKRNIEHTLRILKEMNEKGYTLEEPFIKNIRNLMNKYDLFSIVVKEDENKYIHLSGQKLKKYKKFRAQKLAEHDAVLDFQMSQ